MKKLSILLTPAVLGTLVLASCSSSQMATNGASDNMYFMASDAKLSTEYAVQNNNPETFQEFNSLNNVPEESFSSRNINPDYISRYQSETTETSDDVVYFDENSTVSEGTPDIDVYNNYYVGNSGNSSWANPSFAFNMGFMYGFNPWGFGMYDPFYGPSWGYRPGFSMSFGLGWGFGSPFMRPGFGWGGFYPSYAWGGGYYGGGYYGGYYPGYGFPSGPVYVLPGGEYGDRRVVRGARPTRGATLATAGNRAVANAALPNTARAQARRDVMNGNRSVVSADRARTSSRDFGTSQNDYYNSDRSRIASTRNSRTSNSAAMDRSSSVRSRSAMPTARPSSRSIGTTNRGVNTRSMDAYRRSTTSNPSYRRTTTPSYNRSTMPGRSSSPSYNRSSTPTTRTYTPSRSSSGSVSMPSRSTSSGGGSRGSVSSGSRGGRGN